MRVVVVHYELAEAAALAERLRRDGIAAEPYPCLGPKGFRALSASPPDVILIDLMRMPSYGRVMGELLRTTKGTRHIPLVFLEGDPAKTARVREALPDAVIAPLPRLAPALRRAIRTAPADPVVPGGSSVPIAQKLHIREGMTVALIGAPEGFESHFPGATIARDGEIVLLFAKSIAALARELPRFAKRPPGRALWVLWPKRASSPAGDLSLPRIHDVCAPLHLVAYKTCSIDHTWSAAIVAPRRWKRR